MAEIAQDEVTMEDIIAWDKAAKELVAAKNTEMLLRTRVFKGKFPTPVEGTNSVPLLNDYVLKAKYELNRSVDIEAVKTLAEELKTAGVDVTEVIRYKPELSVTAYKALNKDQKEVFDQCLTIKPGTPSLEIVLPKKKGKTVKGEDVPQ